MESGNRVKIPSGTVYVHSSLALLPKLATSLGKGQHKGKTKQMGVKLASPHVKLASETTTPSLMW